MPKVKKAAAAPRRRSPAKEPNFFERMAALLERYSIAASAGATVILLLIGGVLWAGGYVGQFGRYVSRLAGAAAVERGLAVETVSLRGAHNLSNDEILRALGPVVGTSIAHVDIADARARIEKLGWVRSASVSRLLPDTIHVSVREREPAAVWQIDGELKLIDDAGVVIRAISGPEYAHLPFLVGEGAPEAASGVLSALADEPELQARTYALVRVGERRWDMRLRNETEVKLPETDYFGAIKALSVIQAAHGSLDQPLEYIDLRDPERVVVKKRDAAPEGLGGG